MIDRPRVRAGPIALAPALLDRQAIDAGEAPHHQAVDDDIRDLVPTGVEPVAGNIMPSTGKARLSEGPRLLDQLALELLV
jgi:hypothetical protein